MNLSFCVIFLNTVWGGVKLLWENVGLVVDMLDELAISPVPELLLILGGVMALFVAIKGGQKQGLGASLSGLGFFIGALLILGGARIIVSGSFTVEVYGTLLIVGVGLFFRVFYKVPVAFIVSSILALIAFLVISVFTLNLVYVAIGTLGVFLVCFFVVGSMEVVVDSVGRLLGWRPVLLILGVVALLMAGRLLF
jgi:hypothetical protein